MQNIHQSLLFILSILSLAITYPSQVHGSNEKLLKTAVYNSPQFVLGPGSVENRHYFNIDFPRGHLALKSFNAEVIGEAGNPIPLHETYLHHWVLVPYYGLIEPEMPGKPVGRGPHRPSRLAARNAGLCTNTLGQYFGLGSETRRTATWIPDPYGIEIGNPKEIPDGYEERWMLNVHAIDTRSVEDKLGCTECKCGLYNVTIDEYGHPIRKDYNGGLHCCYDKTHCRLREGSSEEKRRKLYLRYTVKWLDWDESILPVRVYVLDVTDNWEISNSKGANTHSCKVEYEIKSCAMEDKTLCVDNKRTKMVMPHGGDVVYAVAHQHSGGVGSALYGQDGRLLCASLPTYGTGEEAGNEDGYIVGMSTSYPKTGSVRIADGEILTLESNYSSSQHHYGVMGLFYLLVTDPAPDTVSFTASKPHMQELMKSKYLWVSVLCLTAAVAGVVCYRRRNRGVEGYQSLVQ